MRGVQRIIPAERLREYLRELDRLLQFVVESGASDETLGNRAHKIVSQAGMLGLTRMARCACALEDACRAGGDRHEALGLCRTATGDIEHHAMPNLPDASCDVRRRSSAG